MSVTYTREVRLHMGKSECSRNAVKSAAPKFSTEIDSSLGVGTWRGQLAWTCPAHERHADNAQARPVGKHARLRRALSHQDTTKKQGCAVQRLVCSNAS